MRTLQVINVKWFNATAWYAVHLARALSHAGHPSAIVGIKDSLPILKAKDFGLDVYELPLNSMQPKDIWKCNLGIDEICRSFQPDIVNCHRGESFLLWALKKRKFHYVLIRTRGDQRLPLTNTINKLLYKNFTDAIISTNSKMTNYFSSKLHITPKKLYTVLGGIDTNTFYPSKTDRASMRTLYNFTENDVVIGLVGRLEPVKGHKEVLQVFADICKQENKVKDINASHGFIVDKESNQDRDQHNNQDRDINSNIKLHLCIVGGDCEYTMADLCKLGQELGIPQENLHCVGYVENMQKVMSMFDMGLIASLSSETVARVAFEMIACHVPVIGSNVGVMSDILDEKYTYTPYDFARMSELLLLSKDPIFRDELREICVKRFEENHSIYGWSLDAFMEKTLTIYRDYLK